MMTEKKVPQRGDVERGTWKTDMSGDTTFVYVLVYTVGT